MPNEIRLMMNDSVKKMRSLGAILIEDVNFPEFDNNRKLNMSGMIQDINSYLRNFPAARKNFQDICQSDRTRTFGNIQQCLDFMESIPGHSSQEYTQALGIFAKNRNYVEK